MWLAVVLGYCFGGLPPAAAQRAATTLEYNVKVAFIYRFTHYITWPDDAFESAASPFVIAVMGEDPFGPSLDRLQHKRLAAGRPIQVRRFKSLRDVQPTHVLFVPRSASVTDVAPLFDGSSGMVSTLVVCESPGMGGAGSPVNFFLDANGTVGFELNVDAIARRGLRVDAKMLSNAHVIRDGAFSP